MPVRAGPWQKNSTEGSLVIRCYKRLLNFFYKDNVTNEEVRNRIQYVLGVHDALLTMVNQRRLRCYGHISRFSGISKTVLHVTLKGARRRQMNTCEGNIKTGQD